MTVFVDGLFVAHAQEAQAARVGARNGHQWCHMMTDGDDDELHAFALRIGMKVAWHQGDHYDLTPGRRAAAVKLGAVQTDGRKMVELRNRRRATIVGLLVAHALHCR